MLYHVLRAAAHVALRWYYGDVVVQGSERIPPHGPLLIVANHPNALVDAMLVGTAIERRVLITAKATLFEHPLLAPFLRAVGVVPLRRAADERRVDLPHGGTDVPAARNVDAFRQVRDALADDGAVLVFPEGISHDGPALAPLKTGAARMALDAAARGVRGLRLLPLGLVFERKEQLRSRVLVRVGTPLDLDSWSLAHPEEGAAALTAALDQGLREVTLNFASDARAERAVSLARALVAIAEAPPGLARPRLLATEAELATRIERATAAVAYASSDLAEQTDRFTTRVAEIEARLAGRGVALSQVQVSLRLRHGAYFAVREGSLAAVAFPFALLGRVTHWVPLTVARSFAMRPLTADPSRDQPAMRTIVIGLGMLLLWYTLQFLLVAHWFGLVAAFLWLVAISVAMSINFKLGDRMQRARDRARTYLALRRDPAFRTRTLAEIDAVLAEALLLERELLERPPSTLR